MTKQESEKKTKQNKTNMIESIFFLKQNLHEPHFSGKNISTLTHMALVIKMLDVKEKSYKLAF